jgi:tRNA1Val (adenine37-N6)-methyltransferase
MSIFQFKYFSVQQSNNSLKVGTDAMILGASVDENNYLSILDIGTGTGVLALMAKQKNPNAKVIAIDINDQSLIDCKINFKNSPWNNDLICSQQDINFFTTENKFDCIICNPPYYENGLLSQSEDVNRAKHTIDFSLDNLFFKAKNLLSSEGHFWVILPYITAEKWRFFAENIGLYTCRKINVFAKPDLPKRTILKMGLNASILSEKKLIIRNDDNTYSEEYKELTKEFHNKEL